MDSSLLLTQVIVHIIHSSSASDICLVFSSHGWTMSDSIGTLNDELHGSTSMRIYPDIWPTDQHCNMFVAYVHHADEFDRMFRYVEARKLVSRNFIVVLDGPSNEMLSVLQYAWQLRLINMVVLTRNSANEVNAFSYTPFMPTYCEVVRPVFLCHIVAKDELLAYDYGFWYPPKLGDLRGCPLLVATNEWDPYMMIDARRVDADLDAIGSEHPPFHEVDGGWLDGIEGRLVRELSRRMNFRARVLYARVGESSRGLLRNGSYTGISGMVERGVVNMSIGMIGATPDINRHFRFSYPYYYEAVVYALPRSRDYTAFEKLALPFSLWLWLGCAASLVIATLLLWALDGSGGDGGRGSGSASLAIAFIDVWSVSVGGGYTLGGRRAALIRPAENGWLLLWLLVTLVLRTVYQGFMFTSMQQNVPVRPPDTLAEMTRLGYRFMMDAESVQYFESYEVLGGKWVEWGG